MKGKDFLRSYSGARFDPFAPDPAAIHIEDIAHGLAGTFRFSGQSDLRYTVAQHSVAVSRRFIDPELAMCGLVHDAPETWLWDVQRPIKGLVYLEDIERDCLILFNIIEDRIFAAVARRFGLKLQVIPAPVKEADDRELAREIRDLWSDRQPPWPEMPGILPYAERIGFPWWPGKAEERFLERFRQLTVLRGMVE